MDRCAWLATVQESDMTDGLSTQLSTLYTVSIKDHSYRFIFINHEHAVGTHTVTLKMYDFCKVLHDFTYMKQSLSQKLHRDFLGGPVTKTPRSQC